MRNWWALLIVVGILLFSQQGKKKEIKADERNPGIIVSVEKGVKVSHFGLVASSTGKLKGCYYKDGNSKKYYAYINGKTHGPFDGMEKGGDEFPYLIVYNEIEGAKRRILGKPKNYTVFVEGEKYEFKNISFPPFVVLYENTGVYWIKYKTKEEIHFIINGKEITYNTKKFVPLEPNVSQNGKSWGFVGSSPFEKEFWAVVNGKDYLHHKSSIQPSNIEFSADGSKWWWVIFDKKIWLTENGVKKTPLDLKMKHFSSTLTKFELHVSENGKNKMLLVHQSPEMEIWVNEKSYGIYTESPLSKVKVKVLDNLWAAVLEKKEGGEFEEYVIINGKKYGPYSSVKNLSVSDNGESWGFVFKKKESKDYFIMINGEEYGPYYLIEGPVFTQDGSKWAFALKDKKDKTIIFSLYINGKEVYKKKFENVRFSTPYGVEKLYVDKNGRIIWGYTTEKEVVLLVDGKEIGSFPRSLKYRVSGKNIIYAYIDKGKLIYGEK